ncbi:MAG: DUF4350 domain-containing protein [Myxococcota bacterium]
MRELVFVGCVCLCAALAAQQLGGGASGFARAELAAAAVALGAAAVLALRRVRHRRVAASGAHASTAVADALLALVAAAWLGALATSAAELSGARADLTFERRYELADATRHALAALGADLSMTVYADPGDPRIRRTRMLLEEMARVAGARVEERALDDALEDVDRFGIARSNAVVLERANAPRAQRHTWELVEQPTEGPLFEALARLANAEATHLYALVGEGEGDLASTEPGGFSGLAEALATEGYDLRVLPSAFARDVPDDAAAVLAIAPERALAPAALAALRAYLARGGRLVAWLEPGAATGLDALLAEWGIAALDGVVVDPASADLEGAAPGLAPVAFHYAEHPVTRGLDRNRVTFFPGARAFALRKPDVDDRLAAVVTTSGDAWVAPDVSLLRGRGTRAPAPPPGTRTDYLPLVVAGEYARGGARATRIVAFGDADLASNRYLRALYDLDLVMNAVHWAAQREAAIALRPKIAATIQFPVPIQNSLRAFYGVGMLVPQLLLVAGGLVWLRRRGA